MSAIRRDPPFAIPSEAIKTAEPVGWMHALSLAQSANALELAGGTVFINSLHLTITSGEGGGLVTTGTIRHKVPVRRLPDYRVWVLSYADHTASGIVKITPTIAPLNAADAQWATGLITDPSRPTTSPRTPAPLVYWEEVDKTSAYTVPDADHALSYTITWDPDDGGQDITLLSLCCYELDLGEVAAGTYGIDETMARPRNPIVSGASSTSAGGIRQLATIIDRVKVESMHRYLFGVSLPDDDVEYVASSSSHTLTDVFDVNPRVHPARYARTNAGLSYALCTVRAYGRNSATTGGSLSVDTAFDGYTLTGFPIGSYGWVEETAMGVYCESYGNRATPTTTGFQDGSTLDIDADAQETLTSEATVDIRIQGKALVGDAANTLDIIAIEIVQILS